MRSLLARSAWAALLMAAPASALVTFSWSGPNPSNGGHPLAAEAAFSITGSTMQIQLSNTAASDVLVPTDVLTAVFFHLPGDPLLTPVSVTVAPGSEVRFGGGTDPGGGVGGEWAYRNALSNPAIGLANAGVSSVGLGLFGPDDLFPGSDLWPPESPDGLQYGLLSMGDDITTGNQAVTGKEPLIQYSVLISLAGVPMGLAESDISGVYFKYGTSLSEGPPPPPPPPPIPEPLSTLTCLLGAAALGCYRRFVAR